MRVKALKGHHMTLAYLTEDDCRAIVNGRISKLRPVLVSRPETLLPYRETGRLERINQLLREVSHGR